MQTLTEIAQELNCRNSLVTQYMSRSEFAHIHKIWIGHKCFFDEITDEDKKLLKSFIDRCRKKGRIVK